MESLISLDFSAQAWRSLKLGSCPITENMTKISTMKLVKTELLALHKKMKKVKLNKE